MEHFKKRLIHKHQKPPVKSPQKPCREDEEDDASSNSSTSSNSNSTRSETKKNRKVQAKVPRKRSICRSKFRHGSLTMFKLGTSIPTSLCKTKEPYNVCAEKTLQLCRETKNRQREIHKEEQIQKERITDQIINSIEGNNKKENMQRPTSINFDLNTKVPGKHSLPPIVSEIPPKTRRTSLNRTSEDGVHPTLDLKDKEQYIASIFNFKRMTSDKTVNTSIGNKEKLSLYPIEQLVQAKEKLAERISPDSTFNEADKVTVIDSVLASLPLKPPISLPQNTSFTHLMPPNPLYEQMFSPTEAHYKTPIYSNNYAAAQEVETNMETPINLSVKRNKCVDEAKHKSYSVQNNFPEAQQQISRMKKSTKHSNLSKLVDDTFLKSTIQMAYYSMRLPFSVEHLVILSCTYKNLQNFIYSKISQRTKNNIAEYINKIITYVTVKLFDTPSPEYKSYSQHILGLNLDAQDPMLRNIFCLISKKCYDIKWKDDLIKVVSQNSAALETQNKFTKPVTYYNWHTESPFPHPAQEATKGTLLCSPRPSPKVESNNVKDYNSPQRLSPKVNSDNVNDYNLHQRLSPKVGPNKVSDYNLPQKLLSNVSPNGFKDYKSPKRLSPKVSSNNINGYNPPQKLSPNVGTNNVNDYNSPQRLSPNVDSNDVNDYNHNSCLKSKYIPVIKDSSVSADYINNNLVPKLEINNSNSKTSIPIIVKDESMEVTKTEEIKYPTDKAIKQDITIIEKVPKSEIVKTENKKNEHKSILPDDLHLFKELVKHEDKNIYNKIVKKINKVRESFKDVITIDDEDDSSVPITRAKDHRGVPNKEKLDEVPIIKEEFPDIVVIDDDPPNDKSNKNSNNNVGQIPMTVSTSSGALLTSPLTADFSVPNIPVVPSPIAVANNTAFGANLETNKLKTEPSNFLKDVLQGKNTKNSVPINDSKFLPKENNLNDMVPLIEQVSDNSNEIHPIYNNHYTPKPKYGIQREKPKDLKLDIRTPLGYKIVPSPKQIGPTFLSNPSTPSYGHNTSKNPSPIALQSPPNVISPLDYKNSSNLPHSKPKTSSPLVAHSPPEILSPLAYNHSMLPYKPVENPNWKSWINEERKKGLFGNKSPMQRRQSVETISSVGSDYSPSIEPDEHFVKIRVDKKWYKVKKSVMETIPKGKLCYFREKNYLIRYFDDNQLSQFIQNMNINLVSPAASDFLKQIQERVDSYLSDDVFIAPYESCEKNEVIQLTQGIAFTREENITDPELYVEEVEKVDRFVPQDFKGFYRYVTGYQIVNNHHPISFQTFLMMHNTNRIKVFYKKYLLSILENKYA